MASTCRRWGLDFPVGDAATKDEMRTAVLHELQNGAENARPPMLTIAAIAGAVIHGNSRLLDAADTIFLLRAWCGHGVDIAPLLLLLPA